MMNNIDEELVLAHFIVSDDVERSRRFYTEILGGRMVFSGPGGLTYVALSNSWIIINGGGGPTDDKPAVTLETPRDPDRVSSFLNIRVKDIEAVYAEWSARGANFLTPPKHHQYEIRCYIRDPDGHLIEVGQTTDPDGDWAPAQRFPIRRPRPGETSNPRREALLTHRSAHLSAFGLVGERHRLETSKWRQTGSLVPEAPRHVTRWFRLMLSRRARPA
jgi:catechol 2,3-dioxygenase-like lactoylglutathione lyase family enzyme